MVSKEIKSYLNTILLKYILAMDQIPAKFLEKAADALAYTLTKIISLSVKLYMYFWRM